MSDILLQNEFENGNQSGSNDFLDNHPIILEFTLFDRKIGTNLSLGHVSFSGAPEHGPFPSKCTIRKCCFEIGQKFGTPVIPKILHGLGFCIKWSRFHCVLWNFVTDNGNLRKLSIILYGLV